MTINIEDFSVSLDDWVTVEDPIVFYSEVTAPAVSGIDPTATYYSVNGIQIPTTVTGTGINYTISSDPVIVSGSIDLLLHVENYVSEVVEKDYSFLFGYSVTSSEVVDWGANREIVISAYASNTAICPNAERYTTYFTTREYDTVDIKSYILPAGWANISSTIEPQTMQFLYGNTYTITVSGIKDYSNNILPEFSWEFTIENL